MLAAWAGAAAAAALVGAVAGAVVGLGAAAGAVVGAAAGAVVGAAAAGAVVAAGADVVGPELHAAASSESVSAIANAGRLPECLIVVIPLLFLTFDADRRDGFSKLLLCEKIEDNDWYYDKYRKCHE